jgi:hypothetical protein
MGRERRASLADLLRVSSERGQRLWRRPFALFYNFSRFMVSRLDLPRLSTPQLLGRVVNFEEARSALRAIESTVSERPDQWFNFYPVWLQDCSPSRAAKS